jgi:hypothetical protein
MAVIEEISQLAFQNLLLLGFDVDDISSKQGVSINAKTFLGPVASPKAVEAVFHFLLLRLFPSEAGQAFKLLWPIVDKCQLRDFRKFVTDKLVQLQKERELPPLPPIRSSVIDNPCGPKFCQLLLHASQLVMRRLLKLHRPSHCTYAAPFQRNHAASLIRICQIHQTRERDCFVAQVSKISAAHDAWKSGVEGLVSFYDDAQNLKRDIASKRESLFAEHGTDFMTERKMHERNTLAASITNECWRELQSVVGREADVTVTESILFRNDERPRLVLPSDGRDIDTQQSEQLELASLLKRWAACISQLQRHLTRHSACRLSLERLAHNEQEVARLAGTIAEQGAHIVGFRLRLEEYVGNLERSIEQLQAEVQGLCPIVQTTGPSGFSSLNTLDERAGDMDDTSGYRMLDALFSSGESSPWPAATKGLLTQAMGEADADAAYAITMSRVPDPARVIQCMQDVERAARRRIGHSKDGREGASGGDDPLARPGAGASVRAASDAVGPCPCRRMWLCNSIELAMYRLLRLITAIPCALSHIVSWWQAPRPSRRAPDPAFGRPSARAAVQQQGNSLRAARWEGGALGGPAQRWEGPECEGGAGEQEQEELARALRVCGFVAHSAPPAPSTLVAPPVTSVDGTVMTRRCLWIAKADRARWWARCRRSSGPDPRDRNVLW